jgi:serine/threonine protein kinase
MQFIRKVGEGTFKQTFEVKSQDGSTLALKIFKPGFSPERTQREFNAMLRCNHPNIAKLHSVEFFDYEGQTNLTAQEEFLAGGVLPTQISAQECLAYGGQLIGAIDHLSQLRLVHRDLKPDNVMFRADGVSPVIVDFGLVRNLAETSATPTWMPQGPCTPYFASPEQLNNDKHLIDWRSDQFALGIVLSLVTLGCHPYAEPGDTSAWDAVSRVANRQNPNTTYLAQVRQTFSALGKMVSPWPVQRFRTPTDLASAWQAQKGIL